ncbi:MAG TPA: TonB-dependent receptor, partial [Vicinamibacterales bacterium]|nr:TonB-dependent receptor [Vicinamibacterales bacterium]
WIVDKLVNAKNPDQTQALDDNTLKNYSGKAVYSVDQNQKVQFSYNWNNKIRGHRRNTPPDLVPDIASLVQTNPASSTQAKYTGIRNKLVVESAFSWMNGETDYNYQPGTPSTAVRTQDSVLDTANFAAQDQEYQPNSRIQWDNSVSYTATGLGGDHLIKAGVQFARLYFDDKFSVLNDEYLLYSNGKPTSVQLWNTPTEAKNLDRVLGLFVQDSWTVANKVTLNLGVRFDHNTGILPAQSTPGGQYVAAQSLPESTPIKQNLVVWRSGVVYDPMADGKTALKASYSRYGLQVGIDRVTNINPFSNSSETCPWTDTNNDGIAQPSEIQFNKCTGFATSNVHYADANGPKWPHSDEISAGIEREVMTDMRLGVMYYHRTNRDQIGVRNLAVPTSAYTPITINIPNGPNGAQTATVYNLNPAYLGLQNNVYLNDPYLDTNYNGVEVTASKRLSKRWQMVAGFTAGKNTGGLNTGGQSGGGSPTGQGQSNTTSSDLNDPNNTIFTNGVVGFDSTYAFRMSGSYSFPGNVLFAGSLISNTGYPYYSAFSVTRALVPTLTRSSQYIPLTARGDERLPAVTQLDLRVSRAFNLGQGRKIVPQVDFFNVTNANTVQTLGNAIGGSYLSTTGFIPPRIIRVGISANF